MHLISETEIESISKNVPEKDKIKIRLLYLEHVNQLESGLSFGEASLIADTPRNATCYAMSEQVITAVLLKADYRRVLLDRERHAFDEKVATIRQFDLFKNVARRRITSYYRLFYD